jgi:Tfp pilus assembly protein PilN
MIAVNLIPRDRLCRARRYDRMRAWCCTLVVYGALVGGVMLIATRMMATDDAALLTRVERLDDESHLLEQAVRKLKMEVSTAATALAASRAIGEHPDWSVLLSQIASLRGDSLVLNEVEISPRSAPGAANTVVRPAAYTLRFAGVGEDHRAVTQLALRLESLGIFDRVAIIDTRTQDAGRPGMVGFKIECHLSDSNKGSGA